MLARNFIKRINFKKTLLWAGGGFIVFVALSFLALPPLGGDPGGEHQPALSAR